MGTAKAFDCREQARNCYDRLALAAPDVPLSGLFKVGEGYVVVCVEADNRRPDGLTLAEWFHGAIVPITLPIFMSSQVPPSGISVPLREQAEVAIGKGRAVTLAQLHAMLSLALPGNFPLLGVVDGVGLLRIRISRELSPYESHLLGKAAEDVGFAFGYEVDVEPEGSHQPLPDNALTIEPVRWAVKSMPANLAALIEEDEDHWRVVRTQFLAEGWTLKDQPWSDLVGKACQVGTTFEPGNIRGYFSLYSRVVLIAPISDSLEQALSALKVTRKELTSLVGSGHVRVIWECPARG